MFGWIFLAFLKQKATLEMFGRRLLVELLHVMHVAFHRSLEPVSSIAHGSFLGFVNMVLVGVVIPGVG